MAALVVTLLLVVYANLMATAAARRTWDQWHAFSLGNALLALTLLLYSWRVHLLSAAWGHATPWGAALGALAGLAPLAVILVLMFAPGQLGRDIVASGIGAITPRHFVYRLCIQVALTTVVCEEFAFRGVLYALLVRVVTAPWAVTLDACAFGLWHATLQYNGFASQRGLARWAATASGTVVYGLLGLLLALVRQLTGALLPALLAHGVLDVAMFAGMYIRRAQLRAADAARPAPRAEGA